MRGRSFTEYTWPLPRKTTLDRGGADVGIAAQLASGGQLTVSGERSGIGGNFSLWTYRARASVPFNAQ